MKYEVEKLLKTFSAHNKIIIGVDFDDTIFPFTNLKLIEDRSKVIIDLLRKVKPYSVICLYSVSDEQSLKYKEHIMKLYGIKPDYVNESPIKEWGDNVKPYFNLLLDDKAGLNEAIKILQEFINKVN